MSDWPTPPAAMFGCPTCGNAIRLYLDPPRPRWRDRLRAWFH